MMLQIAMCQQYVLIATAMKKQRCADAGVLGLVLLSDASLCIERVHFHGVTEDGHGEHQPQDLQTHVSADHH